MKLSKKQKEVIRLMADKITYITLMKGLSTHCFIHHNLSYPISTATTFKLRDLKLIEERNDKWNACDYYLTELGRKYAIENK